MSVTDGDRAKARKYWLDARYGEVEEVEDVIAQVIAAEREKARAPFLALAEEYAERSNSVKDRYWARSLWIFSQRIRSAAEDS